MNNFRLVNVAILCAVLFSLFSEGCDKDKSPTKQEKVAAWKTYTTKDGLTNNGVFGIVVDADNVKWFGTDKDGVLRFDRTTCKTYNTGDGLVANRVFSIAVDADNVKWFGTADGVSSFEER